jgi:hypothetical protein
MADDEGLVEARLALLDVVGKVALAARLAAAIRADDPAECSRWLAAGADPNAFGNHIYGVPMLGLAVYDYETHDLEPPGLDATDEEEAAWWGRRPPRTLGAAGNTKVIAILLQHGADPNRPGRDTLPPLAAAVRYAGAAVIEVLSAGGADANASYRGEPLLYTALRSHDTVGALVRAGANINCKVSGEVPLLMYAIARALQGWLPEGAVHSVLAAGADRAVADRQGRRAADLLPRTRAGCWLRSPMDGGRRLRLWTMLHDAVPS